MITRLKIANFKSHRNTDIELGNLTVLTGINGVGKSSLLQALLLLRQTYQKRGFKFGLDLNKPLCNIGTANEAWYQSANGNPISFELFLKTNTLKWVFDPKDSLDWSYIPQIEEQINELDLNELSLFNSDFQYISALRMPIYEKDDIGVLTEKQISIEYGKGELVAHYLYQYGSKSIDKIIAGGLGIESDSEEVYLIDQTQIWEQAISPGVTIRANKTSEGAIIIKYGYEATGDNKPLQNLRSENVGFGISYSLPVIVALLSAKPGALILIENPEAHLHPEGQAKIAELISLVSQSGVQVIIETHSDHIINGILVASKKFEDNSIGISKDNVRIYYMGSKDEKHATKVDEIKIIQGGRIEFQPQGFFDRAEIDLSFLMGF